MLPIYYLPLNVGFDLNLTKLYIVGLYIAQITYLKHSQYSTEFTQWRRFCVFISCKWTRLSTHVNV